ncbi:pyridoxamine 5'-phosphate oxidase [Candidatus Vallotia tarda]|nr:pyridoxamine 5'-phosphate oxidase [Candidatus Vallotia tarda]
MISFAGIRKNYMLDTLLETDVDSNPIEQFKRWFEQVLHAGLPEPSTMTLSTVDDRSHPNARTVLVKGVDAQGFTFFTNYQSRKGRELANNPHATLLFYWIELERQVRISGKVGKIIETESDAYFISRPLGSRIGAWASEQSSIIHNRQELESRVAYFSKQFGNNPPRPSYWGGYRLVPDAIEFWQGRPSRLHDRIQYLRNPDNTWNIVRLSP